MSFSVRLRQFLDFNGYNVRSFSAEAGIPERTMHDYLSGKSKPGLEQIEKIIRAGADPQWLICGELNPTISIEIGSDSDLQITGVVGADPVLAAALLRECMKIVDEKILKNPDTVGKLGLFGWFHSVWAMMVFLSKIFDQMSDKILLAKSKGMTSDEVAEYFLTPIRDPLISMINLKERSSNE